MTFLPHVTVAAVLQRAGQFLMIEEQNHGRLVLNNPAGHVEPHESLLEAVQRETEEESGWLMRPTALIGVYQWLSPGSGTHYVRFTFAGELLEQRHQRPPDPSIERTLWLDHASLTQLSAERFRSPVVIQGINDLLSGQQFPLSALQSLMPALDRVQPQHG